MKRIPLRWLLTLFLLAALPQIKIASAQAPNLWDTPRGQACFEQWISVSMGKLNAHNGSADFNARKPWSINKYGVLEGNAQFGPRSVAAPDDFPKYNNNKYWWMWVSWVPAGPDAKWLYPEWNDAHIENIQSYVMTCNDKAGGPPAGPTTVPPPPVGAMMITWTTQANSLPDGTSLRGRNGERFSFVCPPGGQISGRIWGTDLYTDDSSICSAAVHAGLITAASGGPVTIEIRPGASSYTGSTRNGVASQNYGISFDGSFVFVGGTPGGPPSGSVDPGGPQPNTSVTNMTIQAARRRVIAGELVLVPVWLIKAANVANLNFHLDYDANVVKLEGAPTKGDLLENALFSVNPNQSGSVLSGFAQTSGIAGTGTVLNLPFRAIGNPGDRTQLVVTVTTINDPGGAVLQIDKITGEILIYSKDGTFPPVPGSGTPQPPAMLKGDCDGDGSLTESDALCALEMSTQLRPQDAIVDVDQNGVVDSRDAVIILQRALNK